MNMISIRNIDLFLQHRCHLESVVEVVLLAGMVGVFESVWRLLRLTVGKAFLHKAYIPSPKLGKIR